MSVEEMEQKLSRYSRRPPARIGAQTARDLLVENQRISQEKRAAHTLEEQGSRDLIERLFERDKAIVERDRIQDKTRRDKHTALAQEYKNAIADRERAKQLEYGEKVASGRAHEFFPFVEGETVDRLREEQNNMLRGDLQNHLSKQREANPPRADPLLTSVDVNHRLLYPTGGVLPEPNVGSQVAPHICGAHPRFLTRGSAHMSRRLHDDHVRKALQDKVEVTKSELVESARKRQEEVEQMKVGLMINDALRHDNAVCKAQERQKNAHFVKTQMEERKLRAKQETKDQRKECAGYWGPEEKELQSGSVYEQHCSDLVKQMEVNQNRRLDSRHRRLQQERKLVDNSLAEMRQDREKDQWKQKQHKDVLTTTWESQVKIREAASHVEAMG